MNSKGSVEYLLGNFILRHSFVPFVDFVPEMLFSSNGSANSVFKALVEGRGRIPTSYRTTMSCNACFAFGSSELESAVIARLRTLTLVSEPTIAISLSSAARSPLRP